MPNTFSMSPNYVRRFVDRNRLQAPPVDVFAKLRDRCNWLLRSGPLPQSSTAHVFEGDAARLSTVLEGSGITVIGSGQSLHLHHILVF
jgi:hypothetical protein